MFRKADGVLGTKLANNEDLLDLAPWFPFLILGGMVLSKTGAYDMGWLSFLHS